MSHHLSTKKRFRNNYAKHILCGGVRRQKTFRDSRYLRDKLDKLHVSPLCEEDSKSEIYGYIGICYSRGQRSGDLLLWVSKCNKYSWYRVECPPSNYALVWFFPRASKNEFYTVFPSFYPLELNKIGPNLRTFKWLSKNVIVICGNRFPPYLGRTGCALGPPRSSLSGRSWHGESWCSSIIQLRNWSVSFGLLHQSVLFLWRNSVHYH